MTRNFILGFTFTLVSALFFAASGPWAKALYTTQWTPGAVLLLRLLGSSLLLLAPTLWLMRGHWSNARSNWLAISLYGIASFAGMQGFYFASIQYLPVALALLLEMTAPLLVVAWTCLRSQRPPALATSIGLAVSCAGMLGILDPGGASFSGIGIFLALAAALCLAVYYLVSASQRISVPSIPFTGLGMMIGAATSGACVLLGVLPFKISSQDVAVGGMSAPWYLVAALLVIGTVAAYTFGILGLRFLGATVGSFASYMELPFSVLLAWLLLSEFPTVSQIVGGIVLLAGIFCVKWGESKSLRQLERVA
ncbi:DMT family transporter [Glutamicibacter sp. TV12E]|uniref:DMT family transporter n=1 Tax=Glutamicibacter sp. TV12E TaxID=3446362 RepID=UPI0040335E0A